MPAIARWRRPTARSCCSSPASPRAGTSRGEDVTADALTPVERQTFCPYKGLCSYFDVAGVSRAGWAYLEPYREVDRIAGHISFEPDKVTVTIDGRQLHAEPGQNVVSHGPDRGLAVDEAGPARPRTA